MNRFLSVFLITGIMTWSTQATAQSSTTGAQASAPAAASKTAKKKPAKKAKEAVKAMIAPEDDEQEHDITGSTATEFKCELGNNVTIYENAGDDQHIGVLWLKKVHRMTRVGTSTGANRFENSKAGLVWIGIPAKSMLLDSKKGHQLANECRTAEQAMAQKSNAVEPPKATPPKSRKAVKK